MLIEKNGVTPTTVKEKRKTKTTFVIAQPQEPSSLPQDPYTYTKKRKAMAMRAVDQPQSPEPPPPKKDHHIYDWAEKLMEIDPKLARTMQEGQEERIAGLAKLVELNLPRYQYVQTSAKEFLSNPDNFFTQLRGDKYYPKLIRSDGFRRHRLNCSKKETINFITTQIQKDFFTDNVLILSEFFQNYYGGHIVIDNDGEYYGEIVRGECADLTYGRGVPILSISPKEFSGTPEYKISEELKQNNTEFQELVPTWLKTLGCIPHVPSRHPHISYRRFKEQLGDNEHDKRLFQIKHPGYYEFIFTRFSDQKGQSSTLEPIFIDYRKPSIYKLTR
jgi:hypothetical protein